MLIKIISTLCKCTGHKTVAVVVTPLIIDTVLGIGIINTHFRKYRRFVLQHASSEMSHQSFTKVSGF